VKTIKYHDRIEIYNDKDELHSFNNKPAILFDNGNKYWYKNDKIHRDDGPARISIFGSSVEHYYYRNDLLHRVLKPAFIEWDNGIKSYECYYIKNVRHNPIGPARIWYFPSYDFYRSFYIHGNKISFDEFINQLENRLKI